MDARSETFMRFRSLYLLGCRGCGPPPKGDRGKREGSGREGGGGGGGVLWIGRVLSTTRHPQGGGGYLKYSVWFILYLFSSLCFLI